MNLALLARRRSSSSFARVALVFALLLVLGLAAAYVVHDRYVAYGPTVARHVPKGATGAVRFDLTHVMFYEPFRRFLAPVVDQVLTAPNAATRRARLEAQGIRLAGDVREILVAVGPARGAWVMVLGGHLPRGILSARVAGVLREEGHQLVQDRGVFVVTGRGFVFAQADDSAFVLASSTEQALAALVASDPPDDLTASAGGLFLKSPSVAWPLRSVRARFRTGSVVAVDAELAFEPGSPPEARAKALTALVDALGGDPAVTAAFEGSRPPLDRNLVQWPVRLPREGIEALAERAAAGIALASPGPS